MLYPNCTRNHAITYTKNTTEKDPGSLAVNSLAGVRKFTIFAMVLCYNGNQLIIFIEPHERNVYTKWYRCSSLCR
jgi:hypothetical protein